MQDFDRLLLGDGFEAVWRHDAGAQPTLTLYRNGSMLCRVETPPEYRERERRLFLAQLMANVWSSCEDRVFRSMLQMSEKLSYGGDSGV